MSNAGNKVTHRVIAANLRQFPNATGWQALFGSGLTTIYDVSWIRVLRGLFGLPSLNNAPEPIDPQQGPIPVTALVARNVNAPVAMWSFDDGPWEVIRDLDCRVAPAGKPWRQVRISALFVETESAESFSSAVFPGVAVRTPGTSEWIDGGRWSATDASFFLIGPFLASEYTRLRVEAMPNTVHPAKIDLFQVDPWGAVGVVNSQLVQLDAGSIPANSATPPSSITVLENPPMLTLLRIRGTDAGQTTTGIYRVFGVRP